MLQVEAEALLREALKRERELAERERALAARDLESEKARTALAERERAIEKTRADSFEAAYNGVTKKPGFGCLLKKIVTLGLSKCG